VRDLDLTPARLGRKFLEDNGLITYYNAAEACKDKKDVLDTLTAVKEVYKVKGDQAMAFTAIIAPSGTGKTQLAATAAQVQPKKTRYIVCDAGGVQQFYKPHTAVTGLLIGLSGEFAKSKIATTIPGQSSGANALRTAIRTGIYKDDTHPLANFLDKLLFGGETHEAMSFHELMGKINEQSDPFLIFLDETPALDSDDSTGVYQLVNLFRNVLRAIGICPILMSTHSGVHNAVKENRISRRDVQNDYRCLVITRLLQYYGTSGKSSCKYLSKTERPYVAAMLSEMENADLGVAIFDIQSRLQTSKSGAWIKTPIFQLCQLFRSEKDKKCTATTAHSLVREHFAHLVCRGPRVLCGFVLLGVHYSHKIDAPPTSIHRNEN
jgi:hypothetical protein